MPQLMRGQPVQPGERGRPVEGASAEVHQPQHPATWGREHERVRATAGHLLGELVDEEPGHGHGSGLVRLRGAERGLPVDLGDGLGDLEPPAHQVDAADTERGQLPEPQPRVGQGQDDEPVLPCRLSKARHVGRGQEPLVGLRGLREGDTLGRVSRDAPAFHSVGEHEGQHAVALSHGRPGEAAGL
ncbi:MAG: hypothetical protein L0H96_22760 [Humibacillus sp.]|nr:hypothetical protein [Humibacillus sp.]MDN5779714.1 hypothetical protein [Humibacillus sp.]